MSNPITQLINQIRYKHMYNKIQKIPYNAQIEIGKNMYAIIWQNYWNKRGNNIGSCQVHFTCPYHAHITYKLSNFLNSMVDNPHSVIQSHEINKDANGYILQVSVTTSDNHPEIVADAAAMNALLQIPTIHGDFKRVSWKGRPKPIFGGALTA